MTTPSTYSFEEWFEKKLEKYKKANMVIHRVDLVEMFSKDSWLASREDTEKKIATLTKALEEKDKIISMARNSTINWAEIKER